MAERFREPLNGAGAVTLADLEAVTVAPRAFSPGPLPAPSPAASSVTVPLVGPVSTSRVAPRQVAARPEPGVRRMAERRSGSPEIAIDLSPGLLLFVLLAGFAFFVLPGLLPKLFKR